MGYAGQVGISYNATHERLVGVGLKAKSQFQVGGVVGAGAIELHTRHQNARSVGHKVQPTPLPSPFIMDTPCW